MAEAAFKNPFPRTAVARLFDGTTSGVLPDVTCQPSIYTPIATMTVPAQQQITWGKGVVTANGADTRGLVYISLKTNDTTPVAKNGFVRFYITDANDSKPRLIFEERTDLLSVTQSDITTGYRLGEISTRAGQDSKLVIKFLPDSATAVTLGFDTNESVISVPQTVYYP